MGVFRLQSIVSNAKQLIKLNNKNQRDIPKGYLAVYVGEVQKKRFVVPLSYLDQPLFQDLLRRSEDEFGFNHPMGGLTIECREEAFVHLSNQLQSIVSNAKQLIKLNNKNQRDIQKGYLAVYVGEVQKKRFVVPLYYLDQPLFQDLLRRSEDEFGFNHPMGGLTILCREEAFVHLSNQLHVS
ncbi:SAUR-like auxin-responsive protein family protein [Tanacetum coccineum]